MTLTPAQIWLIAFGSVYFAGTAFWARQAALRPGGARNYLSAAGELPAWIVALALSAMSMSATIAIGLPDLIARVGLAGGALALAIIPMALFGALTFKRQWQIGRRFGLSSQGQLLAFYYRSRGFAWLSTGVAILFAVAFVATLFAVLGGMMADLSGGGIAAEPATWLVALMTFAYVIVGGLYAAGALGALQGVLLAAGVAGLSAAAIWLVGGFAALNMALGPTAHLPANANLFRIAGVARFEGGSNDATGWTAMLTLTYALAIAGVQASPMATQLIIAARDDRALAAGQTWVLAGLFGGLAAFGLVLVGVWGLVSGSPYAVEDLLSRLGATSPWFMAAIYVCLLAGAQALAAIATITAAHMAVRDVLRPEFLPDLDRDATTLLGRIAVGLLLIIAAVLATRAPVAAVSLGALALPFAAQLAPSLVGLCWLRWISPPAALVGAIAGLAAVALTDSFGIAVMDFIGLHLPWGRWPWTIHSAGWGLAANVATALVISAITPARRANQRGAEVGGFLDGLAQTQRPVGRGVASAAWAAALAWVFLGVGPGLVFGNFAFGDSGGGFSAWLVGMPPLWGWCLTMWALGVVLVWLVAYRLGLASGTDTEIALPERQPASRPKILGLRADRLQALLWALSGAGAAIAALAWAFRH